MITYKTCADATTDEIFEAFRLGFSDYLVPMTMTQDAFAARFFGPEGNAPSLSFLAFVDGRPIGLALGGIRVFDGLKTMRCGTLCVDPEYRGQGISQELFARHKSSAASAGCRQLVLEVITENHRAIKFYERHGYRAVYTLKYYARSAESLPRFAEALPYAVRELSFATLEAFRNSLPDSHLNWQSDTPYYAGSTQEALRGAFDGNKLIALIAMNRQGKLDFLYVDPGYRGQGLASRMLREAINAQQVAKVTVCLPNNASLEGFLRKLSFEKEPLEQYEMYLPL